MHPLTLSRLKALTMKKLILAPAVALAFTGLVAAPVAAAETPSTQSASAKAEQDKKDKEAAEKLAKEQAEQKKAAEEKAAAEKEAKEKAEQEKKDAAEKKAADKKAAAKKAADKKKADDKADKKSGDDAKDAKKPAPKDDEPKKDDSDDKDDAEEINAQLKVAASSISAEDLATKGVKVTVTGLEKGDKLSTSGLSAPATTASGSTATLNVKYNGDAKDLTEGSKALTVKVQREGVSAQTLSGSTRVIDAQAAIDSELTVDPDEITPGDLADPNMGIQVTVTNLEEGDTVTDSLIEEGRTVDADGDFTFGVYYEGDPDNLDEGPVPFTVTIDREGEESVTLNGEINVVDEVSEVDPKVSLNTDEISASDLEKDGLKFTGEGFTPGGTVNVIGAAGQAPFHQDEITADEDGKISTTVKGELEPGDYSVYAVDAETEEVSNYAKFTVTDDDAVEAIDASLKVDPKEITAADLANKDKGVTVTVTGVKKGDKITDSLTGDTETAEADGDYKLHLYYQGNPDSLEEGKVPFTVTIDREGTESETLNGNITVVAEDKEDGDDGDGGDTPEAPAEASFTVSPKTLEAADFANDKKGVTLAVEDCEPGADVHFEVTPKGIQVTAYENTVQADDEGKASVNVFGTSDNVSAYVGDYTASATCGDDSMKESFTVTAGADGGGSDGGDNGGNDGSQLPRTGADLGGLASGAMLLLVGGAAIAMTGRRKKVGQSPTDF
ncbi:hypothetical protein BAUR920_02282 [Brevibacterium aurantiacum]|uniref:LPXTG cell wall anchor domain-containing protein n=1 Tax=Brevibacterium aurantiacum TaxID=273384 RepID=A0A2H1JNJ1_BREAU|nr:hypothetical protein BAUR920_02282 [Brevibacterium aurantiacum]